MRRRENVPWSILVMAVVSWTQRERLPFSPWWPTLTLVWVLVQGLFGKYTVTLKLYPLIVTLHLLGGLLLLALQAFLETEIEGTGATPKDALIDRYIPGADVAAPVQA